MEWPRIPLPGWPGGIQLNMDTQDGQDRSAADACLIQHRQVLAESAARGRELAQLLDPDTPVPGVTQGALRPEIAAIAVPATIDGGNMTGDDFALTAGWGHFGAGDAVMPGQGRVIDACLHVCRTCRLGRCPPHTRRNHLRHLSQRPRLLAQPPRCGLALQARRLPGPQEMALLPGAQCTPSRACTRGSPALSPIPQGGLGDTLLDRRDCTR